MAATAKCDQLTNIDASPPTLPKSNDVFGKVRIIHASYTASAALAANSTIEIARLHNGLKVLPKLSYLKCSQFGAGRTIDVGYTAHTKRDGTSVVADVDAFADALDVSSAAVLQLGNSVATGNFDFEADVRDVGQGAAAGYVEVQAKVLGDTMPQDGTLDVWLAVVQG